MYHVILTNRYLTTRVIPLIAVAAVAMCVALVIIVVSVMTGFLEMVKNSGRTLMGDVVVSYSISGIPAYDRLVAKIEALPEAAAASPVVDAFGLLRMPYPVGEHKKSEEVQVWGIDAESFARVTGYLDTLYWKPPTDDDREEMSEGDFRRYLTDVAGPEILEATMSDGTTMRAVDDRLAMVLGIHVSIANQRQRDGSYTPGNDGFWWMPGKEVGLTLVPIGTGGGTLDPETKGFQVVNEFLSGVFLIDKRRVMIPIGVAQEMLRLEAAEEVDEEGEETGRIDPARATMVLVRAAEGVTPLELRDRVADAYDAFRAELLDDDTVPIGSVPPEAGRGVVVETWLQQQAQFINPIEKERELMRVLFSIIYLVCAGLVLSIFWAIVYEKTRDIGILRSVGASRFGITLIFLRYGAIIGVIGSILGLGLAYLVVRNINAIHNAMGEQAPSWVWIGTFALAVLAIVMVIVRSFRDTMLPVVLWSLLGIVLTGVAFGLMQHRGTLIWDPSVYYFSEIPNHVDYRTAWTTMVGAVLFSVLGAFIPATKAADTDPVKALRYE